MRLSFVGEFSQDIGYGLRVLRGNPGFSAVIVVTLALGIAANATVFGWIDRILVHPIPGTADDQRLVVAEILTSGWNSGTLNFCYSDYRTVRDNLKLLSGIALNTDTTFSTRFGESVQRVYGELVSGNYFEVLGVRPILGRVFLPEEYGDKPGAYPAAVISERLWRGRLGADPGVIGRTLYVNRYPLTIVGVVPAEFFGTKPGLALEIWVPLMMTPQLTAGGNGELDQGSRDYWTIARLKPGVTVAQARGEIEALARRVVEASTQKDEGLTATVVPVWKSHTGGQSLLLAPLGILMAVCFVVLLIVCSNVANLLLARSVGRQKEFSIRLALGAGRLRLARQLVTEVLLLAIAAAIIGLFCVRWMGKSLVWLLPPTSSPVAVDVHFNADLAGFTLMLCLAAALACSVVPVLHSVRIDANEGLKEGGRGGTSGTRTNRMRNLLVVAEIALAFVALVGAGLFVRTFNATQAVHPGFDARNVSVAQIDLSGAGFTPAEGQQFCVQLRDRLKSAPGIVDASYSDRVPLGFGLSPWQDIQVEGYVPARGENMKIYHCAVAPGFFEMMRIPIIEGRDFTDLDNPGKTSVMIINQSFLRRFFSGRNPIGRKVLFAGGWAEVVGVVKDCKYHSLAEDPQPYIFVRQSFRSDPSLSYFVRSIGGSIDSPGVIRREALALNRDIAVFEAMSLKDYMGGSMFAQRIAASMLSALGGVSLILAVLGLYAVMAYSVSQRTQEIGVRMALGAQRHNVIVMVIRQGMILTGVGLLTGLGAALAAARLVSGLLFGVSAGDPSIFAGIATFLSAVALLACSLPAWRAVRIDPIVALRHE